MNKETTFTEVITNTYKVTDVSPEDGITFDYTDLKKKTKKLGFKWRTEQNNCKKCKKAFHDGDRLYLAITNRGNFFMCKDCAKQLRRELGKPDYCKPENINK
jgi:rRNA maturation endonuclease Nob1